MTKRKVMRGAELRRIGNDLVLTDCYPDGTKQTVIRPIEEWLIIKAWVEELSEDHDGAVAPELGPSHEEGTETGEACACTRTGSIHRRLAELIDQLNGAQVSVRTTARRGPVMAICDGEVHRT